MIRLTKRSFYSFDCQFTYSDDLRILSYFFKAGEDKFIRENYLLDVDDDLKCEVWRKRDSQKFFYVFCWHPEKNYVEAHYFNVDYHKAYVSAQGRRRMLEPVASFMCADPDNVLGKNWRLRTHHSGNIANMKAMLKFL